MASVHGGSVAAWSIHKLNKVAHRCQSHTCDWHTAASRCCWQVVQNEKPTEACFDTFLGGATHTFSMGCSFHHCNCTVWIQTLFSVFQSQFEKPQRMGRSPGIGEITIALTPKEHFIRASRAPWSRTPVIEFPPHADAKTF